MTEKQRQAWLLKYLHEWPLQRIALRLGGTRASVSDLLRRARLRSGATPPRKLRKRRVYAFSLSSEFEF